MNNKLSTVISKMNEYGKDGKPFFFIFDFELENPCVFLLDELIKENIFLKIKKKNPDKYQKKILLTKKPIEFSLYKNSFDFVVNEISKGNSYLLNLTFPTEIETNLTLEEIFVHSTAKYKLLYKDQFVVFSPETFVKIEDGIISSYPMKGTIDASLPNAEEAILNDEKEFAEHVTIVDLIRNDLSIISKNVRVEKFRYVEKIITNQKELLQVSSKIVGELEKDYNERIGDIIYAMLPAGSISGAPKKKTIEIIQRAEKGKRGFYTGVFGIFDGKNLDSAVMIRFIEKTKDKLFFRSGGGITFMSNLENEYQELIDKIYVPII
jgi:para-aminobenzoate synthetase component 1